MGSLQPGANLTAHLPTSGQAGSGPGAVAASFAAGVLAYLPQLLVWTLPSMVSYDRMQPNTWSGAFKCAQCPDTAPSPHNKLITMPMPPCEASSDRVQPITGSPHVQCAHCLPYHASPFLLKKVYHRCGRCPAWRPTSACRPAPGAARFSAPVAPRLCRPPRIENSVISFAAGAPLHRAQLVRRSVLRAHAAVHSGRRMKAHCAAKRPCCGMPAVKALGVDFMRLVLENTVLWPLQVSSAIPSGLYPFLGVTYASLLFKWCEGLPDIGLCSGYGAWTTRRRLCGCAPAAGPRHSTLSSRLLMRQPTRTWRSRPSFWRAARFAPSALASCVDP